MEMADWQGFEERKKDARQRGKIRGIGMSNTIERVAAPGIEAADTYRKNWRCNFTFWLMHPRAGA